MKESLLKIASLELSLDLANNLRESMRKEMELLRRQNKAMKQIIEGVANKSGVKVNDPIFTIHPSFQQMASMRGVAEIDNVEVLERIERKLKIHGNFEVYNE